LIIVDGGRAFTITALNRRSRDGIDRCARVAYLCVAEEWL